MLTSAFAEGITTAAVLRGILFLDTYSSCSDVHHIKYMLCVECGELIEMRTQFVFLLGNAL